MNTEFVVSTVFLAVSLVALVVQGMSRRRLRRDAPAILAATLAYRGLLRTSTLRVCVAVVYVVLGVATIIRPDTSGVPALCVFAGTQIAWMLSGLADVQLKRRLAAGGPPSGRHRRR